MEVDYVRAKILGSGTCLRNGVLFPIDQVLGAPSKTILEELQTNTDLRWILICSIIHSGWWIYLRIMPTFYSSDCSSWFLFLSAMYDAVMDIGLATVLLDPKRKVTLFVPTNGAFSLMRDPAVPNSSPYSGRNILDDRKNLEVLKRVRAKSVHLFNLSWHLTPLVILFTGY